MSSLPVPKRALAALCFFLFARAYAGDCMVHPLVIYEAKVLSCEKLTRANVHKVVSIHLRGEPESFYDGVIIEASVSRAREVIWARESASRKTEIGAWKAAAGNSTTRFLARHDFPACVGLAQGETVELAYATSCECDTGPRPTGYCAVTVKEVSAAPKQFSSTSTGAPSSKTPPASHSH